MPDLARVLIVDDDRAIRWVLERALAQSDLQVESAESASEALRRIDAQPPEVLVTDIRMPGIDGLDLLAQVQERYPQLPVIVMTAHSDLDSAVASYQAGAFEYLPKPFDVDEALTLVRRAVAHARKDRHPVTTPPATPSEIIGEAPAMQEVFRAIGRLSQSNITVLINGESGTGKERVAQALHQHSPRAGGPFIALNMAAIPKELMESELFGHEKGAFTGATALRRGRFEQADDGTLFLDEIGDMPPDTQTRLLRVLSDGEFYRVGGHVPLKANVRIIAATHQNLEALVEQKRFREDLFHRLNVIRVHLPRLAERAEDIPCLARHFLAEAARELAVEPKRLTPQTERHLARLPWPGNVRQLENTCRWLTVMTTGREILVDDLPMELREIENSDARQDWREALRRWAQRTLASGSTAAFEEALAQAERILIETALSHTGGRRGEAAKLLGWGRNTLTRKLNESPKQCDEKYPP
ncbi:nitrogen regulation protein NR(I) [Pistricoccus aurantiacus]|uniref:DNA-binding transcriptional regulator NtrC n=1 Tax=Pistricoccus aurantiacus TaxID=1883414 RepID=A0A5B8SRN9_9GAMM|nr:nitrogen regulation protein NR(I) [Pistricoccus aurantiacus]QEA38105.1 nitrogen regulation protein NR(I) [Pistricoccus aurantiacus]